MVVLVVLPQTEYDLPCEFTGDCIAVYRTSYLNKAHIVSLI